MKPEEKKGVKVPLVGNPKGSPETEFSKCCTMPIILSSAKGGVIKICKKCRIKISEKEVKNDAKREESCIS